MNKYYANISMLATPSDPKHLVNKEFVELLLSRKIKDPVVAVATADLGCDYDATAKTLTQQSGSEAAFILDAVAVAKGDRVLVAGQTDATQNGIYVVTTNGDATTPTAGVLTRASDFDSDSDITPSVMIPVMRGEKEGDVTWQMVNDTAVTLGTDDITFGRLKASSNTVSYTGTVSGDGSTKELVVAHNLGTEAVQVSVKDHTTGEVCIFNVEITSADAIKLKSDIILETTDSFDVTVIG